LPRSPIGPGPARSPTPTKPGPTGPAFLFRNPTWPALGRACSKNRPGARGGARGGEARCGSRDSGFRGGRQSSGAQGFQDGEACVGALSDDGETRGVPRGSVFLSF